MAETKTTTKAAAPLRASNRETPAEPTADMAEALASAEALEAQLLDEAEMMAPVIAETPTATPPSELARQLADLQVLEQYLQRKSTVYQLYRQYAAAALAPSDLVTFSDPQDPAPEFHVTGSGAFKILNKLGVQVVIDRIERVEYAPSRGLVGTVVWEAVEALRAKDRTLASDPSALAERLAEALTPLVQSAHYGYVIEGRFRFRGDPDWTPVSMEVSTKLPFFGLNPLFGRDPSRVPEQFMRQYAITQLYKLILRVHGLQRMSVADLEAAGWPPERIKRVVLERRARRPGGGGEGRS